MNYQRIYDQIILKTKSENRIKHAGIYYENHHIIPKCLKGNDDKENLVLLTAREHYICHKLLTYIYKHRGINLAFFRLSYDKRKRKVSSRDYAYAKELMNLTPMLSETREKISNSLKGKAGKPRTQKEKEHLSIINIGKNKSDIHKKHISEALINKSLTDVHKLHMSQSLLGKNKGRKLTKEQLEARKKKYAILQVSI